MVSGLGDGRRVAAAVVIVLVLLAARGVLVDPAGALWGNAIDTVHHAWGQWWWGQPGHEGDVNTLTSTPFGERGALLSPLTAIVTAPVRMLGGAILAYNLSIVATILLDALSVAWCARVISGDWRAGAVAAVAMLVGRSLWVHAALGVTEGLAVGWVALALGAAVRCFRKPSAVGGALVGALCGVAVLENPYALVLVAPGAVVHAALLLRRARSGALAPLAAATAAGLLPIVIRLLSVDGDLGGNWNPQAPYRWLGLDWYVAAIESFVRPSEFLWPLNRMDFIGSTRTILLSGGGIYLGWTVLGLALWGAWRAGGWGRGLLAAGAACVALGLGEVPLGLSGPPGPFLLVNSVLFRLDHPLTQPHRFFPLAGLFLALGAGIAARNLGQRGLLGVLILLGADAALLGGPSLTAPTLSVRPLDCFAQLPAGAVHTVRTSPSGRGNAEALLLQLQHGQAGTHQGIGGWSQEPREPAFELALAQVDVAVHRGVPVGEFAEHLAVMDSHGIRWLVLSEDVVRPEDVDPVVACDGWQALAISALISPESP